MSIFFENPSGQPYTATWYPQITTEDGQERRYSSTGVSFWCMETQPNKTTRAFRDALESKNYSAILASTNISKLKGIKDGAKILYDGAKRTVIQVDYDKGRHIYYLAIS